MTTVYELLYADKGRAYKEDKIKSFSYLRKKPEIDKPAGALAGKSRIHGDVELDVQRRIIDMLVEIGARYKLCYRDISHLLLICKIESGFNPDAAAGTTTAAGLGQYTSATVEEAAKPHISQKRLSFTLDLSGDYVFDAERGAYGVVLSYMIAKERAMKYFGSDFERHLYLFHHEGWYFKPDEEKMAAQNVKDVMAIINRQILPVIDKLEKLLVQRTELSFKLVTKDDKPYTEQPYLAIFPSPGLPQKKPASVQAEPANKVNYLFGKTDGSGKTDTISLAGLSEVLFVILNKNYKELLRISSHSAHGADFHVVAKNDTLGKIAKDNGLTVKELQNINSISDPNQIKVGQRIALHKGTYLWRRPPLELIGEHLQKVLNVHAAATPAIVEHKRSHIALPKGNEAQKNKEEKGVIAIRGGASGTQISQRKKEKDIPHTTVEKDIKKTVNKAPATDDMALKEGLLFPLPVRSTADFHSGMRKFGSNRGKVRKHAGCDLYAPLGTEVRAMADGTILRCYSFYWKTDAIEVDHGDFIVRYGEIAPRSKDEQNELLKKGVKRGEVLGTIGQLIQPGGKKFAHTMLHLEIYKTNKSPAKEPLSNDSGPFKRRSDLIDPTATLDKCVMSE